MSRKKSLVGLISGLPGRIREVRGNLSQIRFAELLGVNQGTVHKYEKGIGAPSIETLSKIAKYGGVTVEWLLHGEGPAAAAGAPNAQEVAATYDARPTSLDHDALAHTIFLARDWLRRKKQKLSVPGEAKLIALLYEYWLDYRAYPDDQVVYHLRLLINE